MWGGRGEVWDGRGEILLSDSLHLWYVPALEARAVISQSVWSIAGHQPGHSGNMVPRPFR